MVEYELGQMVDFERARRFMVDNQLRTSDIQDWRILAQMGSIPRELFVPEQRREIAYIDDVQPLGSAHSKRFLSSPATFAKLVQLAEIEGGDSVLDVGAANGYSTAVLAGLAGKVVGVEDDAELAGTAAALLEQLGIGNARVVAGKAGNAGKTEQYDAIIVEGALEASPTDLFPFLADGGRLVGLIRQGAVAVAHVFVRTGKSVATRADFNASLPLLYAAKPDEAFVF